MWYTNHSFQEGPTPFDSQYWQSLIDSLEQSVKAVEDLKSEAPADPAKDTSLPSDINIAYNNKTDYTKPSYYKHPDPLTYAFTHNLGPCETLCLKYITRWREKDGIKDLRKARECLNRLINHEANLKRGS